MYTKTLKGPFDSITELLSAMRFVCWDLIFPLLIYNTKIR